MEVVAGARTVVAMEVRVEKSPLIVEIIKSEARCSK